MGKGFVSKYEMTYQVYECMECGKEFRIRTPFVRSELKCPHCGQTEKIELPPYQL